MLIIKHIIALIREKIKFSGIISFGRNAFEKGIR